MYLDVFGRCWQRFIEIKHLQQLIYLQMTLLQAMFTTAAPSVGTLAVTAMPPVAVPGRKKKTLKVQWLLPKHDKYSNIGFFSMLEGQQNSFLAIGCNLPDFFVSVFVWQGRRPYKTILAFHADGTRVLLSDPRQQAGKCRLFNDLQSAEAAFADYVEQPSKLADNLEWRLLLECVSVSCFVFSCS